jgi:hypothetical protein
MSKRFLLSALVVLALSIAACKSSSTPTPSPTATPTPTPNPSASIAVVDAYYDNSPFSANTSPPNGSGTVYANEASSGCPGSTQVTGSTISAQTGATLAGQPSPQPAYQATLGNLVPLSYYVFFYIAPNGATVSSQCTNSWTSQTITLRYP